MERDFRKSDAVVHGWDEMKRNFMVWLFLQLVVVFINFLLGKIIEAIYPEGIEKLLDWVLDASLLLIMVWITLRLQDARPLAVTEIFSSGTRYLRFLGAVALYDLILLGGFLLLVIPMLIWAPRFLFAPWLVVDEGLGPVAALHRSSELTRGVRPQILVLLLLLLGINILGALALLLGLFATVPTSFGALAWVLRRLQGRLPEGAPAEAQAPEPAPAPGGAAPSA